MENYTRHVLIVNEGPAQGQSYTLQDTVCTMGRTADNAVVIDSPRISRHHAQIRLLPDVVMIEDMGSTNGTYVNSRKLTGPHRLVSGDIVGLADYITFRFETEAPMRTEKLPSAESGPATQAMTDVPTYPAVSRPPAPTYAETYPQYEDVEEPPAVYSPPPQQPAYYEPTAAPRPKRSKWVYIAVVLLLVAICICVTVAVYLWFAPVEFWEQVFQIVGIPMP